MDARSRIAVVAIAVVLLLRQTSHADNSRFMAVQPLDARSSHHVVRTSKLPPVFIPGNGGGSFARSGGMNLRPTVVTVGAQPLPSGLGSSLDRLGGLVEHMKVGSFQHLARVGRDKVLRENHGFLQQGARLAELLNDIRDNQYALQERIFTSKRCYSKLTGNSPQHAMLQLLSCSKELDFCERLHSEMTDEESLLRRDLERTHQELKKMKKQLESLFHLQVHKPIGCPDGWMQLEGVCFLVVREVATWFTAIVECTRQHLMPGGSSLATVQNLQTLSSLRRIMVSMEVFNVWIGAVRGDNNILQWLNGAFLGPNFLEDGADGVGAGKDCGMLSSSSRQSKLSAGQCHRQLDGYVCQLNLF